MTTATVEALTAEVRALMVGKRQVTLSVYRQLDYVSVDDLEPFGRVNVEDTGWIGLVGRRQDSGELARARVSNPGGSVYVDDVDLDFDLALPVRCINARRHQLRLAESFLLPFSQPSRGMTQVEIPAHLLEPCPGGQCGCNATWDPGPQRVHIQEAVDVVNEHKRKCEEIKRLPLIVLAGLK